MTEGQGRPSDYDGLDYDMFGNNVAVSGNVAVAGSWKDPYIPNVGYGCTIATGCYFGSAHVFTTDDGGSSWTQTQKLTPNDSAQLFYCGRSVGVSGNIIVVGCEGADALNANRSRSVSGAAYVFTTFDGGASWTQTAKLTANETATGDSFGFGVAISGSVIVVRAFVDQIDGVAERRGIRFHDR